MKQYVVWFHYNKPESTKQGCNVLTVHYRDTCHLVHNVVIHNIFMASKNRATQPHCVIAGEAGYVDFKNDNGKITAHIWWGKATLPKK